MLSKINGYNPAGSNYRSKTNSCKNQNFTSIYSVSSNELGALDSGVINFLNEHVVNTLVKHKNKVIAGYSKEYNKFFIACENKMDGFVEGFLNQIRGSKYKISQTNKDVFNSSVLHIKTLREYNPGILSGHKDLNEQDEKFATEVLQGLEGMFAKKAS